MHREKSFLVGAFALCACSNGGAPAPAHSDVSPDADADADTDADADADADGDADADTDADTDTDTVGATGDTGATSVPRCEPERLVVQTAGTVANPGAQGFMRFSACVDPEGQWRGVQQIWWGDIDATVLCMYTWEVESTNLVTDCDECDWAFQFNWGIPYEDGTTKCAEGWGPPAEWYNPTDTRIGFYEGWINIDPDVFWDIDGDGTWTSDSSVYHGAQWPFGPLLEASFDGEEWLLNYDFAQVAP